MKLRSSSLSTSIEVINGGQNIVILPIRKGSVSQITSQFEVNTHNLEKYYLHIILNLYIYIYIYIYQIARVVIRSISIDFY